MTHDPEQNRQAGFPIGSSAAGTGEVAHGDRREEAHYEADPEHVASVKFNEKPPGPLPPDEHSAQSDRGEGYSSADPVQDVAVSTSRKSVWDARPPEDSEERSGNPTGH